MQEQGYGLLIAATPAGAHPALAATEALPALAAVPPRVLLGAANGSVVQLADPGDPHAVLAQLRTAAAHRGPLLLYIAGELLLDSKQRLPHLALSKSSPRSVRYTGLPWHWLESELAGRAPGSTTLVLDLIAEEEVHRHRLIGEPEAYGCLAPPPAKRQSRAPLYSRALAGLLRNAAERPPMWQLHQQAAQQAVQDAGATGREVFLAPPPPPQYGGMAGGHGGGYGGFAEYDGGPAGGQWAPPAPSGYGESAYGEAPAPGAGPSPEAAQPPPPAAPAPSTPAPAAPAPPAAPPAAPPGPPAAATPADPLQAIADASRDGRHGEAMAIAIAWETAALRKGGPGSEEAIHWTEVRADLAHRSGDAARGCELWLHAAGTRLQTGQDPQAEEVSGAVDRAHHCWQRLEDTHETVRLGRRLAELREWSPGRQEGALEDVRTRLAEAERTAEAGTRPEGHPREHPEGGANGGAGGETDRGTGGGFTSPWAAGR